MLNFRALNKQHFPSRYQAPRGSPGKAFFFAPFCFAPPLVPPGQTLGGEGGSSRQRTKEEARHVQGAGSRSGDERLDGLPRFTKSGFVCAFLVFPIRRPSGLERSTGFSGTGLGWRVHAHSARIFQGPLFGWALEETGTPWDLRVLTRETPFLGLLFLLLLAGCILLPSLFDCYIFRGSSGPDTFGLCDGRRLVIWSGLAGRRAQRRTAVVRRPSTPHTTYTRVILSFLHAASIINDPNEYDDLGSWFTTKSSFLTAQLGNGWGSEGERRDWK